MLEPRLEWMKILDVEAKIRTDENVEVKVRTDINVDAKVRTDKKC